MGNSCEDFIFGIALKDICHVKKLCPGHDTLVEDSDFAISRGFSENKKKSQKLLILQLASSRLQDKPKILLVIFLIYLFKLVFGVQKKYPQHMFWLRNEENIFWLHTIYLEPAAHKNSNGATGP